MILFPWQRAVALVVESVTCVEKAQEAECDVKLRGKVGHEDVLVMSDVSDVDIARFEGREIGRTGFILSKKFYSAFVPRFYALDSIAGIDSPVIKVHCWSLLGAGVGIRYSKETVRITSQANAMEEFLLLLLGPLLQLLLVVTVGIVALPVLRSKHSDGWQWTQTTLAIFFLGAILFNLSMTKMWRAFALSFMSRTNYFCLHGLTEAVAIWGLTEMIRSACFADATSIAFTNRDQAKWTRFLARANLAVLAISSVFVVIGANTAFRAWHSRAVLLQTTFAALVLAMRVHDLDFPGVLRRALRPSLIFLGSQFLAIGVLCRDAVVYMWFHQPGEKYYIQYAFLFILLAGAFRASAMRVCEQTAKILSDRLRTKLRDITTGEEQLRCICRLIESEWRAERVSVTSIIGGETIMLASVGPQAHHPDKTPVRVGPLVDRLCQRRFPIYVPTVMDFGNDVSGYSNPCLLIPFIQQGEVVAAISVMAKHGTALGPFKSRLLHSCSSALESEVTGAIGAAILERSQRELKDFAIGMSGMVMEHMNAWGQIQKDNPPMRRVVLSADGLKTTCLDQVGVDSAIIFSLLKQYRAELYAGWIAIKQVFELVSSDVHGDDFWVVSPLKFKDPDLAALGSERVVLICASLIEEHSRMISSKPEFRALARFGSHVAVGAGTIELVALGTSESMCPDIHGHIMSKLHRIRGEADPGSVLVDMEDERVREAVNDDKVFVTRSFGGSIMASAFKDLHVRPDIAMLVGLKEIEILRKKRPLIEALISSSPYLTKAGQEGWNHSGAA